MTDTAKTSIRSGEAPLKVTRSRRNVAWSGIGALIVLVALFAFAAVVIGGLGSLWGTLLGGIILGVAQQVGAQINISYELLAGYLIFLLVLVVRPQGLISRGAQS